MGTCLALFASRQLVLTSGRSLAILQAFEAQLISLPEGTLLHLFCCAEAFQCVGDGTLLSHDTDLLRLLTERECPLQRLDVLL